MDINSANPLSSLTQKGAQQTPATTDIGKDEFLRLFTEQLKAQDPLNPMDSTGFTAQLAQFSSLEQLTNLNQQMTNLLNIQTSLQGTMATTMIGKQVKVAGNNLSLQGTANGSFTLGGAASKVVASVYDGTGKLVRQLDLGARAAGSSSYTWDGKDGQGNKLPDGSYSVNIAAVDSTGKTVNAATVETGKVTGVTIQNNTTYLVIDGSNQVKFTDVQEISGGA